MKTSTFHLIILSFHAAYCYRLNTENHQYEEIGECEKAVRRAAIVERATVVLDSPSAIHGKWVSEGCEIRPGPEFLLRSYTFYKNGTFKLLQFYYSDESCSTPGYTITARGQLRAHGLYSLYRVSIIPHTPEVAYHLSVKMNATCPSLVRKRWKPHKEYYLFNLSEEPHPLRNHRPFTSSLSSDEPYRSHTNTHKKHHKHETFNCLLSLSLVFHELHHFKVQIRPGMNDKFKTTYYRQELLLGDIHSRLDSRASYKPTAFQVPLLRVDASVSDTLALQSASLIRSDSLLNFDPKGIEDMRGRIHEKSYIGNFDVGTISDIDSILSPKMEDSKIEEPKNTELLNHCHVCAAVAMAHERSPPHLLTKIKLPLSLTGEWVSVHCEQRPMNLYLTRHFRFYAGDRTWIVEYKFFYDTICSGQSFSVTAAGHYKVGKSDHHTPGGTEVDFHVEKASLTVFDQNMLDNLKQDLDCGIGPWKLGYPREMSSTHGCPTLGLAVPSVEYELLRVETDFFGLPLLFMGQVDTENRKRGAKDRPTSYQAPLIRCENLPAHSESLRQILNSPLYGDDTYTNYGSNILAMEMGHIESSSSNTSFSITLLINLLLILTFYR